MSSRIKRGVLAFVPVALLLLFGGVRCLPFTFLTSLYKKDETTIYLQRTGVAGTSFHLLWSHVQPGYQERTLKAG